MENCDAEARNHANPRRHGVAQMDSMLFVQQICVRSGVDSESIPLQFGLLDFFEVEVEPEANRAARGVGGLETDSAASIDAKITQQVCVVFQR